MNPFKVGDRVKLNYANNFHRNGMQGTVTSVGYSGVDVTWDVKGPNDKSTQRLGTSTERYLDLLLGSTAAEDYVAAVQAWGEAHLKLQAATKPVHAAQEKLEEAQRILDAFRGEVRRAQDAREVVRKQKMEAFARLSKLSAELTKEQS